MLEGTVLLEKPIDERSEAAHRIDPTVVGLAARRRGGRVCVVGADGVCHLVRVERVIPARTGGFTLIAAVIAPRRLRGNLIATPVDGDGVGPAIRAAPEH